MSAKESYSNQMEPAQEKGVSCRAGRAELSKPFDMRHGTTGFGSSFLGFALVLVGISSLCSHSSI